jgi:hypothetical protein
MTTALDLQNPPVDDLREQIYLKSYIHIARLLLK